MNKEYYVESQLNNAFINNVLLNHDKEEAYEILMEIYEISEFVDIIDTYLSFPNVKMFLYYFTDIREKLIAILETTIFTLNNIENEELVDEAYETQLDLIDEVDILNFEETKEEKKKIETYLLLSRGIDEGMVNDKEQFLRKCYVYDYKMLLYLNKRNEEITFNNNEYLFILSALHYYFSQIIFTGRKEEVVNERVKALLSFNYTSTNDDVMAIKYYKRLVSAVYKQSKEIDFDDYMEHALELDEEEKENIKKEREKCIIYNIEEYKIKSLKH